MQHLPESRVPVSIAAVARASLRAAAFTLVAACGGGSMSDPSASASAGSSSDTCNAGSEFPTAPLATVTTESGKLQVAVRAAPLQPLVAGLECIELTVTDPSTGAPVEGLTLSMVPWMPAMGHGASVTPAVTPLGEGRYVFTDVSLFMPGEWQLRTTLAGAAIGPQGDSVDPTFSVD